MKSRQQPEQLPPPRVPLQEDCGEARPGVVAFKRRTVVTHDGGTVSSAVADAATVSHSNGCSETQSATSDLLDTAIIDSEPLHVCFTPPHIAAHLDRLPHSAP